MAETTSPGGGADTLAPVQPAPTDTPVAKPKDTLILGEPVGRDSIRPFSFRASDEDLADLKRRIAGTRWPERETVSDDTQGVRLDTIQKLADYWLNQHDWRKVEAKINSYPNFVTNIDGLDIHFIHVKSKHEDALPLIVTHGWPGSIIEQLKIIEPLTDPTAHGGTAEDAFDVVIPSMPGYGFSEKPATSGWGPKEIAKANTELMRRLGYKTFVAQGGDWGAIITDFMGVQAPPELAGIHTNMAGAIPPAIDGAAFTGAAPPDGLDEEELQSFDHLSFFYKHGLGYAQEMGNRPQTLYGLSDSPMALAAWIIDHDIWTYRQIERIFDGEALGLTKDDIVDNITLYWLTNTGVSSARLYWENTNAFFAPKGVKVPVVVSVSPDDIPGPIPRKWAEAAYPNLLFYRKHPEGAHFAAWEQPKGSSMTCAKASAHSVSSHKRGGIPKPPPRIENDRPLTRLDMRPKAGFGPPVGSEPAFPTVEHALLTRSNLNFCWGKAMHSFIKTIAVSITMTALATGASAQTAWQGGATPYIEIKNEPAPKLIVDQPLPEGLPKGLVWIQYRAENVRISPVLSENALNVSPRVGHLHITVDDLPWLWADTSNSNTIDIFGLPPGPHKVKIDLVDANHNVFPGQSKVVSFTMPNWNGHH